MIYFTSDLHLGHRAIISMANRPFENVEEMNRVLIDNINRTVKQEDTLYILGDLCYRIKVDEANELISQINCKNRYLLIGNHDKQYDPSLFVEMKDFMKLSVATPTGANVQVALMHYPLMSWPHEYHGGIHLHGHIHSEGTEYNARMRDEGILRYDVGVDANGYKPVSFEQIISFMLANHLKKQEVN